MFWRTLIVGPLVIAVTVFLLSWAWDSFGLLQAYAVFITVAFSTVYLAFSFAVDIILNSRGD